MGRWLKNMTDYSNKGDAIYGERIVCQFRKKNNEKVIRMTGSHRGTRMVISKNAYCAIIVPMTRIG